MSRRDLPHIDEHAIEIAAPPEVVWPQLWRVVRASFSGAVPEGFAGVVGARPARTEAGDEPREGDSIVGFRVAGAHPAERLVLEGRHRFSAYRLGFHLDDLGGGRTRVRARTDAVFPGVVGRVYRALVIGSRGHVLLLRRMLGAVRSRAERG